MFKLKNIIIAAIMVAPMGAPSLLLAQAPELPAGPAQQKVTAACTECHESRIILQQRLSKATWTKEVDKMIKWGAVVDAADRDAFIEYLSVNFPADKPAEPTPRSVYTKK